MWKRIFSLIILMSLFSFSFCFAFDVNSFTQNCLPTIIGYWNKLLYWVNSDAKPWLETNLGPETRREFEKEFAEALRDVPVAVGDLWNKIKELIR